MRTKLTVIAVLGGFALLAGCKKHEEPAPENNIVEAPAPVETPKPAPVPVEAPKPKPAAPKAKPPPPTTADQQVLDDADATGMTARVDRSGAANSDTSSGDGSH